MDDWGNQLQHEAINVRFEKGIKRMQAIETELHAAREELRKLGQPAGRLDIRHSVITPVHSGVPSRRGRIPGGADGLHG